MEQEPKDPQPSLAEQANGPTPEETPALVPPNVPAEPIDIAAQAAFVLESQSETLNEVDREYLTRLSVEMKGVDGILSMNPNGTYAPMNAAAVEAIEAESSTGPVRVKIGYRFISDETSVVLSSTKQVLSNESLTHKLAKKLLIEQPHDFKAYMKRGYYDETSNYWK